jgi:hypothetical protein
MAPPPFLLLASFGGNDAADGGNALGVGAEGALRCPQKAEQVFQGQFVQAHRGSEH